MRRILPRAGLLPPASERPPWRSSPTLSNPRSVSRARPDRIGLRSTFAIRAACVRYGPAIPCSGRWIGAPRIAGWERRSARTPPIVARRISAIVPEPAAQRVQRHAELGSPRANPASSALMSRRAKARAAFPSAAEFRARAIARAVLRVRFAVWRRQPSRPSSHRDQFDRGHKTVAGALLR